MDTSAKRMEENRPVLWDRLVTPISRALSSEASLEIRPFFLSLKPCSWEFHYAGTAPQSGDALTPLVGRIEDLIARYRPNGTGQPWSLADFETLVTTASRELRDVRKEQIMQASAEILKRSSQMLGWIGTEDQNSGEPRTWVRATRGRSNTRRWFQDVLNYAHHYRFYPGPFREDLKRRGIDEVLTSCPFQPQPGQERCSVVAFPHYLRREGLISDDQSALMYLAEYFYATDGGEIPCPPGELSHAFLPLAGLGQWRAAACWIMPGNQDAGVALEIQHSFHLAIQELLSLALIDAALSALGTAIVERQGIHEAFSTMWWADRVTFSRNGVEQAVLCRDTREDAADALDRPEPRPKEWSASEKLFSFEAGGPVGWTRIFLNLAKLEFARDDLDSVRNLLGFDLVVYDVRLFDGVATDAAAIDATLNERLSNIIRLHHLQRTASRLKALEGVGHTQKNTIKTLRWQESLEALRALPLDPRSPEGSAVNQAIHSLSQYILVEGMDEVLRLASLCHDRDFHSLSRWTSPAKLQQWYSRPEGLFDNYCRFVENTVAVLCYGRGEQQFLLERIEAGGTTARWVETTQPPGGDLSTWIMDGALAPFLVGGQGLGEMASHTAMFGSLIEPVVNALKVLPAYRRSHDAQLRVIVEDRIPDHILVRIGNEARAEEVGDRLQRGCRQTNDLLKITHLGRMEARREMIEGRPGHCTYWVDLMLTPHRLAEQILKVCPITQVQGGNNR